MNGDSSGQRGQRGERAGAKNENRYAAIIRDIFEQRFSPGLRQVSFDRDDIVFAASKLDVPLPKNIGDVLYTFRYQSPLPPEIMATAPEGETWIIRPAGRGKYRFALVGDVPLEPNPSLAETKIPDATPGMIAKYAFGNEQGVLARIRYNRLLDIFLGIACYSLQNHFRTTVSGLGQVETDEIYVGVDKRGAHYVLPVQAKGGSDKLNRVQIEQDIALCAEKLPDLICRPIGTQWMREDLIALFEFEETDDDIRVVSEKHYRLVAPDEVTGTELRGYRLRLADHV